MTNSTYAAFQTPPPIGIIQLMQRIVYCRAAALALIRTDDRNACFLSMQLLIGRCHKSSHVRHCSSAGRCKLRPSTASLLHILFLRTMARLVCQWPAQHTPPAIWSMGHWLTGFCCLPRGGLVSTISLLLVRGPAAPTLRCCACCCVPVPSGLLLWCCRCTAAAVDAAVASWSAYTATR